MKVLGIVGSRRKKGNTSLLVQEALKAVTENGGEAELAFLRDYDFKGCSGCEGCRETYQCVINDGMQELYLKLRDADAIVIGSPTYFYNVTSEIKAFIERCYCYELFDDDDRSVWMSLNEVLGIKYAVVIAVCEQEDEKDMGVTAEVMEKSLWALGYRTVDTVKVLHAFKAGEVLNYQDFLVRARKAGIKLVKTLELKEKVQSKVRPS